MSKGTFEGTIAELERLARKTDGRITYAHGVRVTMVTRVIVDSEGNMFGANVPRHKAQCIGKCHLLEEKKK